MGRDGNKQKKAKEADKYSLSRRDRAPSKETSPDEHRGRSHPNEVLPPAPPLTGNVRPRRYVAETSPSPSPPCTNGSHSSDSSAGVAPVTLTPSAMVNNIEQVVKTPSTSAASAGPDGGLEDDKDIDILKEDWSFVDDFIGEEDNAVLNDLFHLDSLFTTTQCNICLRRNFLARFSDLTDDVMDKYLSRRAKRIKGMLEDSLQKLINEGPRFPTTLLPTSTIQGQRSLNLPSKDFVDRLRAGCVYMALKEIQGLLVKKPLKKAAIIEAIEATIQEWIKCYGDSIPDGVKQLMSHLETMAMRLEGKAPPSLFKDEVITLAEKEARPLLEKLDAALTLATSEVKLLRGEIPCLEEEISTLKVQELEKEKKAEELEREAADMRKTAKGFRSQQRNVGTQLECLKIAAATFDLQTGQLAERKDEINGFLELYKEEQQKATSEEPPEAALILAYACKSPEST
ncbi:unnamed protein product [Alopecurus aequalis]